MRYDNGLWMNSLRKSTGVLGHQCQTPLLLQSPNTGLITAKCRHLHFAF